ncbi:hypothetical protein HHK36_008160 [Tetracentron sinense]|uniref:Uncharacterized protein n=1 Tax=Tetracentron sinense TaxID=13715 RepID=A0A834ZHX8_TETSI|nr:hypothetical protein HHK36_008160 [Tetracentron sinense]
MVCQAASQTRFRALKHENGIAGSATIIVRVIACFQPLQDCQVIVFYWMEKDYGSWLHPQQSAWQSPNLNSRRAPVDMGRQDTFPISTNPYSCMVSGNETLPMPGFGVSELPGLKTGQTNEPHGWFYCLPHYRRALAPAPNSVFKEKKIIPSPYGCHGNATPNAVSESVQKRFLVFDQSGNQTNVFYSSVFGTPVQHPTSGTPKPFNIYSLREQELAVKKNWVYQSRAFPSDENHESGEESEMHEDTEELNALLYSDDDYKSGEDDEETSTGHSPNTMAGGYVKRKEVDGSAEEVASCTGPTKRRRLLEGEHNTSPLVDTASSVKPNESSEYEDDAESSCAKGSIQGEEMSSFWGNKQLRKERIHKTVCILRSIIPGGKGKGKGRDKGKDKEKDTMWVLDEAIHYLRSLKLKAKPFRGNTLE